MAVEFCLNVRAFLLDIETKAQLECAEIMAKMELEIMVIFLPLLVEILVESEKFVPRL
jgi:hypothetical protein